MGKSFAPIEVETGAGDVLFVPGGIAHQVENLDRSLAVSMNYVDASNVADFLRDADAAGSEFYVRWRDALEHFKPSMLREPPDLPWRRHASGPRAWEVFE